MDWKTTVVSYPLLYQKVMATWIEVWQENGWAVPQELGISHERPGWLTLTARRQELGAWHTVPDLRDDNHGSWPAIMSSAAHALEDALRSRSGQPPPPIRAS